MTADAQLGVKGNVARRASSPNRYKNVLTTNDRLDIVTVGECFWFVWREGETYV